MKNRTDWNRLRKMTDEDIRKAVEKDPDAHILTDKELSEMKRVNPKHRKFEHE